jgi:hypothetical protein
MTARDCWLWCTAWPRGFVGWIHTAVCALTTDEGRKGWAMLAALGCAVMMTAYAGAALWLVKTSPMLVFWLGVAALVINVIVVTGLMVLLGIKRDVDVNASKDGIHGRLNDFGPSPPPPPPAPPPA